MPEPFDVKPNIDMINPPADRVPKRPRTEGYDANGTDIVVTPKTGQVFDIQSYHLLSASQYFRTRLTNLGQGVPRPMPVDLILDERIETSEAVCDLLNMITNKPILEVTIPNQYRFVNIIKLAKIWECDAVLEHLRQRIRAALGETNTSPDNLFMLGVMLDDPNGCRRAIIRAGPMSWAAQIISERPVERRRVPDADDTPPQRRILQIPIERPLPGGDTCIPGASVLDLTAMSELERAKLPVRYLTALLRASRKRGDYSLDGAKGNWKEVAEEFYRQIT